MMFQKKRNATHLCIKGNIRRRNIVRNIDKSDRRTSLITDEVRVYKGGSRKDRAYWLDPAQRYLPQYIATDYIGLGVQCQGLDKKQNKRPQDINAVDKQNKAQIDAIFL